MYISARERRILKILTHQNGEIPVNDIAIKLDVSARTIHRDLKLIEKTIGRFNLTLKKKSGSGVQLVGSEESKSKFKEFIENFAHHELTAEERQSVILSRLLMTNEPTKLIALADELNITVGTIGNDLDAIVDSICKYDIQIVRKRGYGVEVIGSEADKRKVMSYLLASNLELYEFFSIFKENQNENLEGIVELVNNRLLGLVDKNTLVIIEKEVNHIRSTKELAIDDSSYVGLVVHLALAIERISHGEVIHFDENILSGIRNTNEFGLAKELATGLENVLNISINEAEVGYITMHLLGTANHNSHMGALEEESLQVGLYVQKILKIVSNEIKHDLTKNKQLFKDLVTHLKPALYRVKQNMRVTNPLIKEIKRDYEKLFIIVSDAVREVFPDLNIPEEEIGFLVIHIASTILHSEKISDHKALVVCASGIGTSKMLAARLKKAIPSLDADFISMFELTKVDLSKYDTIISTIRLKEFSDEYLLVSPLLSDLEIEKIRQRIVANKHFHTSDSANKSSDILEVKSRIIIPNIERMVNFSTVILDLLKGFQISHENSAIGIENILLKMCEQLNVVDDVKSVVEALLERELQNGIAIPGTSLALFHTRHEAVRKPSFTIARLNNGLVRKSMDGGEEKVSTILLLLSPTSPTSEALEVMSDISAMIIQNDPTTRLFESGSESDVLSLISNELNEKYIEKKY